MKEINHKTFKNGSVYLLKTDDGYLVETTDTFLPYYTKDAIGRNQNFLYNNEVGSRYDRWMIGVSVMSGCPVHCKFCATGKMKKWRNLTLFFIKLSPINPNEISKDNKLGDGVIKSVNLV